MAFRSGDGSNLPIWTIATLDGRLMNVEYNCAGTVEHPISERVGKQAVSDSRRFRIPNVTAVRTGLRVHAYGRCTQYRHYVVTFTGTLASVTGARCSVILGPGRGGNR
jgi:hypothetical protein